jgi:hypothetical protein
VAPPDLNNAIDVGEIDRLSGVGRSKTNRMRVPIDRDHTMTSRPRLPDRGKLRDIRPQE